jgi:hypothetical protein
VAQVVACLLGWHEVLRSNHSTTGGGKEKQMTECGGSPHFKEPWQTNKYQGTYEMWGLILPLGGTGETEMFLCEKFKP